MMKKLFLFAILITLISCGGNPNRDANGNITNLPTTIPTVFTAQEFTPLGVRITTVTPINDQRVYRAIDEGVSGAIRSYQAVQPTWQISPAEFDVMFINPQVLNEDGSPAILVHSVQSAGTVIGVARQPFSPVMIVLPHQKDMDWRYLKYLKFSAWNEAEHFLEWRFSQPLFYTFAVANDVHPHTPRVYLDGEERE